MSVELPIAELIIRYLNGERLNEHESERLKLWLSEADNLQKLESQFRDPDWMSENLRLISQVDEIDHWRKFLERLDEHGETLANTEERMPVIPVRRIKPWKYAAAAAAIIAILGGGYWALNRQQPVSDKPVAETIQTQDLTPGGHRAILTLGNGSKIVLDSANNGDLAQQGMTKVSKRAAGQLSYQSNEANGKPAATLAEVLYNTVTTPAGSQYEVALPDGSKVWLNASSSLRFPTAFSGSRKVQVTGEAYFEIAKDSKLPFIVQSGDKSIAVLGTSFDVNAYDDEPIFAVSLVNGAVRVQQGASQETLRPGQQAQVSNGGIRVNDHVNLRQVTAWKDGLFKFSNTDIQTVMREIGRWYSVKIVYEGKVPDDRFTGTMDRSLNASDVLKILALSKVHFRIEGQTIVVMPD